MPIIPNDIRFSKQRFESFDGPAKEVAKDFLKYLNFKDIQENLAESNGNFSKIWDVKATHPKIDEEWRLELEIKKDWGTKWLEIPFKWPTMDIPYRKRDKAEEHATHHIVIGGDLKRLFIVNRNVVIDSPVTYKKVRNRNWQEEPFFNIPLPSPKSAFWFKNKDNKWIIQK